MKELRSTELFVYLVSNQGPWYVRSQRKLIRKLIRSLFQEPCMGPCLLGPWPCMYTGSLRLVVFVWGREEGNF